MGKVLKELFPTHKIYQEYNYDLILKRGYDVYRVDEEFRDKLLLKRARRLRADWVILDLMLVFEYQGGHHYEAVDYTGDPDKAESDFQRRVMLDKVKNIICKEANFILIEVPYWKKITKTNISSMIDEYI